MILVLEGAEGAGKTTLAHKVHRLWKWGSLIIHHSKGSSNPDYLHRELMALQTISFKHLIIMDRWWYSDYVYSALESRPSDMGMSLDKAIKRYDHIPDLKMLVVESLAVRQQRAQNDDAPVLKEAEGDLYDQLFGHWDCNMQEEEIYEALMQLYYK